MILKLAVFNTAVHPGLSPLGDVTKVQKCISNMDPSHEVRTKAIYKRRVIKYTSNRLSVTMYEVIVLKEGYSIKEGPGQQKACGSITLLKGPQNIIVDTGNPWDRDLILEGLKQYSLTSDKIQYVVCTHGHSDHVGNLNLFTNAIHIVSHDICVGDQYMLHDFAEGIPYEIDDSVEVISTPGHTGSDVSVLARNTQLGKVAITGDLFECFEDLDDYTIWQDNSENPELQLQNRMEVLKVADWIIPGHGSKFKVPDEYRSQMRMVMYYESKTIDSSGIETTESSCVVVEED